MKPIIGVTPDFNAGDRKEWGGREPTYFLRDRYIRAVEELGGVPLILPLVADLRARRSLLTHIDGLLLTGSGPDLAPELYGERQRYKFKVMSQRRSTFELEMAQMARSADIPLLGICGGMQAINVAFGGNLYQDIPAQVNKPLSHRQQSPATKLSHEVKIARGSLLRKIMGVSTIRVNSSHHQSVKDVAPSLIISATAPDGIIEAIESSRQSFLLGVQWHPEFLFDKYDHHRQLFEAFLRAAGRCSTRT
ncbi:gamma-glutamyl-gamma-aminobutyrate hydrolase family protein [Petrachloros mirabilis]